MLQYNPNERPSAKQMINHVYFKDMKANVNKIPGTISPVKDINNIESDSEDSVAGKKLGNNSLLDKIAKGKKNEGKH